MICLILLVCYLFYKYIIVDYIAGVSLHQEQAHNLNDSEIAKLTKMIKNDDNSLMKGIGVRLLGDNKTVILMYEIKNEHTYNRMINEYDDMIKFVYKKTCPLLHEIEKTGNNLGYEYYYNDEKPFLQLVINKDNCIKNW